jgi:hypothetical protein
MSGAVHLEVWLASGYALFLGGVAAGLELLARHTHRRAERYHTVGFHYLGHLDVWECPTGQHLHRTKSYPEHRVAHYRAPAHTCNACGIKNRCTDSEHGREIVQTSHLWLETEIGRFHRGVSMALLLLAQFILVIEFIRYSSADDRWVLGSILAPVAVGWTRMLTRFRAKAVTGSEYGRNRHFGIDDSAGLMPWFAWRSGRRKGSGNDP